MAAITPQLLQKSASEYQLSDMRVITAHEAEAGFNIEVDSFALSDPDEGGGLEQSAHQLLEYLYPLNLYRSPKVKDGKSTRELTDLLAFNSESICLIEAKVLSIISTQLNRSGDRRARGVEKQIKKALQQLEGAIKKIKAREEIFTRRGQRISINSNDEALIHGIVLISSMEQLLNWREIAKWIITKSRDNMALFHVLDLMELQRLIAYSQTPDVLGFNLCNRLKAVFDSGNAFILGGPPPSA